MFYPLNEPWERGVPLGEHLRRRGVSRRDFLAFCGEMGAMLGLSSLLTPRIAKALEQMQRPSVVWLSLQECTGCTESILRSSHPTIGDLVLDLISLDYQENLQAAAGSAAEAALHRAMEDHKGEYILVVTGSVPLAEDGIYTMIGGRTAREILEEGAAGAAAILAVGACAHFGSVQAAAPNPTRAVGVDQIIKDKPVVNIAGCPPIADTITATIVHYLTFGRLPAVDYDKRPLFAYGARIHDQCSRRANFDAGQFVKSFDDEAARKAWCLYEVGCKGPATFSPCPIFQWNGETSWPIGAGHPCLGCTERMFWDTMTPFYQRMPKVSGFGIESTADTIGAALAVGATAGVAAHAAVTGVKRLRERSEGTPQPGGQTPPAAGRKSQEEDGHGQD
ncbi:MAG TPA: hydrogenase small subunit [Gemmatimonadota bacterium]|nr:hydrogenase small subunit [Gemmatimonadota bacterium]